MAHYRQVLGSDFEKLSALVTNEKTFKESSNEHAILGLHGVETEKYSFDTTSIDSTVCNKMQEEGKDGKTP